MKVRLEKTYPMPASADIAWSLLRDIEAVAGCMPGARITERVDEQHYKGTVAVKLGPASLSFRGDIEVRAIEPATRALHLFAKGTDTTGGSGASMELSAHVDTVDADHCNLVGTSEVTMSGKAATFGARMMGPVSEQVLQQFAANFASRLTAMAATPPPPAGPPGDAGAASAPSAPAPAPEVKPIGGLSLLLAVLRSWWRSLFATRKP